MCYMPILTIMHHTVTPVETEEEQGPNTHHSTQRFHASMEGKATNDESVITPAEAPVTTEKAALRRVE